MKRRVLGVTQGGLRISWHLKANPATFSPARAVSRDNRQISRTDPYAKHAHLFFALESDDLPATFGSSWISMTAPLHIIPSNHANLDST